MHKRFDQHARPQLQMPALTWAVWHNLLAHILCSTKSAVTWHSRGEQYLQSSLHVQRKAWSANGTCLSWSRGHAALHCSWSCIALAGLTHPVVSQWVTQVLNVGSRSPALACTTVDMPGRVAPSHQSSTACAICIMWQRFCGCECDSIDQVYTASLKAFGS